MNIKKSCFGEVVFTVGGLVRITVIRLLEMRLSIRRDLILSC